MSVLRKVSKVYGQPREIEANLNKIKVVLEMVTPRMMKKVQRLTGRLAALNHFMSRTTNKCLTFFKILRKVSMFEWTLECKEAFIQLKKYLSQSSLLSKPQPEEDLFLYLVVLDVTISVVLFREEKGVQLLIYYVSYSMISTKTKYPSLEKLVLALLVASQKRRPYF